MITPTERRLEPLEDQVGDRFVNRQEELALFFEWLTMLPTALLVCQLSILAE